MSAAPLNQFIVITGLSGAGRSLSAGHLEDLGWFVIDNMPPTLVPKVAEMAQAPGSAITSVALVVGTGAYHDEVLPMLAWLRSSAFRVRVLFLEAATETLVRRYDATRRRHPLSGDGRNLVAAIERERELLEHVKGEADVVLDTSGLNSHELRRRVATLFAGEGAGESTQMTVLSFGYKHGLPLDADLVLDCRFLPNPHWIEELRPLSGLDSAVRDYVLGHSCAKGFLGHLKNLLVHFLPAYGAQGKTYVTVALGCTGGRHRSVAMAEQLAAVLRGLGFSPSVLHRDVDK